METKTTTKSLLGEIVAWDFRSAAVFKEVGIDFCCGGKKSLEQACQEKNLDTATVLHKLRDLEGSPASPGQNFKDWPLDFLCDYIVNTHHKYVLKTLPELVFYTQKIASVHGANHRELLEVYNLFGKINQELLQHLQKEEEVLFPAIRAVLRSSSAPDRETIQSETN
jgi:regulator of cell morphogenesis and NO signaling